MSKIAVGILAVALVLLISSGVQAIDDPSSISVNFTSGYTGVIETGDILLITQYNITYTSIPSEPASQSFILSLRDGVTELQSRTPVPHRDKGYGDNVASFYFTSVEASSLGVVFGSSYTVRLQGNPTLFPSPPTASNGAIIWRSALFTESLLTDEILSIAADLEASWSATPASDLIAVTVTATFLTSEGEEFFTSVIPDLRLMAPELFVSRIVAPIFTERTHSKSYAETLKTFWNGTSIGIALNGLADFVFGCTSNCDNKRMLFRTILLIAFIIFLNWWSTQMTGRSEFGMLASLLALPIGALMGLTDLVFVALLVAATIFSLVFTVYLKRA